MKTVGNLLSEFKEKPVSGEELPVLTLTERNGFVRQSERFNKRLATEDTSYYKVVRRDDIAFNPYLLWAGAVAQNTIVEAGVISPLYPTFRVKVGNDPKYVARLLLTARMIKAYDQIAFGSVPRRRRSSVKDFLALEVGKVPSYTEQHRIAEILDRADEIRAKRRQQLAHLDTLTQSIFREMFGDIRRTRWETFPLGEVVSGIGTGISPKCEVRPALEDEWGVLKLSAVTQGVFKPTENKAYLGDVGPLRKNEVHEGDVLMTRKNTRELVGAVAIAQKSPARLLLPDLIFRLVVNSRQMDPQYFQSLMMSEGKRAQVRELSGGSAGSMPNISMARLKKLPIELPPLDIQRTFAERVEVIHVQRAAVEHALAADDELFASLQSCAFRGEL